MTTWLIIVVAVIYAVIAVGNLMKGNIGLFIMWASYALANVGLYITEVTIK
jgi:hypothetical protein